MKAWHFCRDNRRLEYEDDRIVRTGRTYRVSQDRPLKMCQYGLHASKELRDALIYSSGSILCRVELSGEIVCDSHKCVAYERKVLAMADVSKWLFEFACLSAERAMRRVKWTDERSWRAVEIRRKWVAGQATDDELRAAYRAARSAADSAADSAARSAAYWAAYSAADSAARSAADWAAYSAADWAAYSAAYRAARSAARSAADSAERAWQNRCLLKLIRRHTKLLAKG